MTSPGKTLEGYDDCPSTTPNSEVTCNLLLLLRPTLVLSQKDGESSVKEGQDQRQESLVTQVIRIKFLGLSKSLDFLSFSVVRSRLSEISLV